MVSATAGAAGARPTPCGSAHAARPGPTRSAAAARAPSPRRPDRPAPGRPSGPRTRRRERQQAQEAPRLTYRLQRHEPRDIRRAVNPRGGDTRRARVDPLARAGAGQVRQLIGVVRYEHERGVVAASIGRGELEIDRLRRHGQASQAARVSMSGAWRRYRRPTAQLSRRRPARRC